MSLGRTISFAWHRGTWGARCQTDDKIAFSSAVDELANYFDDRFNGMR
jgi:hypothetical protein